MEARDDVKRRYLADCVNGKIPVRLYLRNGFQLCGVITASDDVVLTVDADGVTKMIYQSAVSTIEPAATHPRQHYVGDWPSPAREFIRS